MKGLIPLLSLFLLYSCSSTKSEMDRELEERENEDIQREYKVIDASSNLRPAWIEDAEIWAKQYGKDTNKFRYFSYETTPKVDREIACALARTNAKSDIAGEIASFIEKTLASTTEGQATIDENDPQAGSLREYVENRLAQKTMSMINGASIAKTYWEKRRFEKDLGAKRNFKAYTCAVLVRMPANRLNSAIKRATDLVIENTKGTEQKEVVKRALEDVSDNFVKARQGMI